MLPLAELRLSDLVRDSKIETEFLGAFTQHIFYESGSSARERHIRKEERWSRESRLGQGAYGTVYLEKCVQGATHKLRAVKEVKKFIVPGQSLEYLRELEAIVKFSNPRYLHCFVRSDGWFEAGDSIFITMEYLKLGDLQRHLTRPLPESEARDIAGQVLEGLGFMHENGFVHRDVKPGNIMVVTTGPDWFVKIADFGISKRRQADVTSLRTLQRGTLGFAAPESLGFGPENNATSYTFSVDMWSLGAMTYRMITNALPFENMADMFKYVSGMLKFPAESLEKCNTSYEGRDFILKLMSANPQDRPTAVEAAAHPWSLRFKDTIKDGEPMWVLRSLVDYLLADSQSVTESDESLGISMEFSDAWSTAASKVWSEPSIDMTLAIEEPKHMTGPFELSSSSTTLKKMPENVVDLSGEQTLKPSPASRHHPPFVEDCEDEPKMDETTSLPVDSPFVLSEAAKTSSGWEATKPFIVNPDPGAAETPMPKTSSEAPHPESDLSDAECESRSDETSGVSPDSTRSSGGHVSLAETDSDGKNCFAERKTIIDTTYSSDQDEDHKSSLIDSSSRVLLASSPEPEIPWPTSEYTQGGETGPSNYDQPAFPESPQSSASVQHEKWIVKCSTCDENHEYLCGPIEYRSCGHYMCHVCLLKSLGLSLLSPKYMPPRCCDRPDGEIFREDFRRILIDPVSNVSWDVWEVWEHLKNLKKYDWTCPRGHPPRELSLPVTMGPIPVWKHRVTCSKCVTDTYCPIDQAFQHSGNPCYRYDEYCLYCSKMLTGNCKCGISNVVDNFMKRLYHIGALKNETPLLASGDVQVTTKINSAIMAKARVESGMLVRYQTLDEMKHEDEKGGGEREEEEDEDEDEDEDEEYEDSDDQDEERGYQVPVATCYACRLPANKDYVTGKGRYCYSCIVYICESCRIRQMPCACPPQWADLRSTPRDEPSPNLERGRNYENIREPGYTLGVPVAEDTMAINNGCLPEVHGARGMPLKDVYRWCASIGTGLGDGETVPYPNVNLQYAF